MALFFSADKESRIKMECVITQKEIYDGDGGYEIWKTNVPAKLWIKESEVEKEALDQIQNLAMLPFAFHHVAIMPDVHKGYGMPIGGVLATEGVVVPNAVGVDIGCGMCAVKTSLKAEQLDKETIKKIFGGSEEYHGGIRSAIPVGFSHRSKKQDESLMPEFESGLPDAWEPRVYDIISQEYQSALKQLGTLGGGNHFIEIQKDEEDFVWIMIHSGSRNLGFKVANSYNKIAIDLNEKWHSSVPKKWELAFLPLDSEEGQAYLREMKYCVDFALANRQLMMSKILEIFNEQFGELGEIEKALDIDYKQIPTCFPINIAHNYASMENHFGKNVMVHRKGATLARENTIGIIPGSQGTSSYIVKGKGNKDSFMSCSHGAGRRMSRTKAENELDLQAEIKILDDQGIIHGIRNKSNLDEAAGAYKDIDKVMAHQSDLVDIVHKLTPLAVIKG